MDDVKTFLIAVFAIVFVLMLLGPPNRNCEDFCEYRLDKNDG